MDSNPRPTVLNLAADLAGGRTSSRELAEGALAQICDPAGEGARTFVRVYADTARAAADAQDRLRKAGYVPSLLAGLPISLKDLFDVSGRAHLGRVESPRRYRAGATGRPRGSASPRGWCRFDRPHEYDRVRLFRA